MKKLITKFRSFRYLIYIRTANKYIIYKVLSLLATFSFDTKLRHLKKPSVFSITKAVFKNPVINLKLRKKERKEMIMPFASNYR